MADASSKSAESVSESWAKVLRIVMNAGNRPLLPTIVLVHGGWIGPETFSRVIPRLERAGYSVFAPRLPSSGSRPALASFDEDVQVIRHTVQSLVNSGKDVVLVMHSYGAVPSCEAMKYFDKQEHNEAGVGDYRKGRVIKLVFLTAMVLPVGGSTRASEKGDIVPGFECKVRIEIEAIQEVHTVLTVLIIGKSLTRA
jgi:pimeloyl-ACP methyl ester carboxylesterase